MDCTDGVVNKQTCQKGLYLCISIILPLKKKWLLGHAFFVTGAKIIRGVGKKDYPSLLKI